MDLRVPDAIHSLSMQDAAEPPRVPFLDQWVRAGASVKFFFQGGTWIKLGHTAITHASNLPDADPLLIPQLFPHILPTLFFRSLQSAQPSTANVFFAV